MKKENNDRHHKGIKGWRPDQKERRIDVAAENKERYDKLTPIQKLAKLDHDLGEGVGAKRQRQKLQDIIEGKTTSVQEVSTTEVSSTKDEHGKKHLKAKDRRKLEQKHNHFEESGE